jgi:hypothetical protein
MASTGKRKPPAEGGPIGGRFNNKTNVFLYARLLGILNRESQPVENKAEWDGVYQKGRPARSG